MSNETELMDGVVEAVLQSHYAQQYQGESITADAVADPAVQTAFERYRAAVVEATVKDCLTVEELDKPVTLAVVKWEGRLQCAYLNNFRIVGGKPWGGGTTEKKWETSLREVIRAFPALQKAVALNYLGKPAQARAALTQPAAPVDDDLT